MKVYMIICISKDSMDYHNIIGEDLVDAIKKALNENLEYFGNEPESCGEGIKPRIVNGERCLPDHILEKYARWHVTWLYELQDEPISGSNYGYFVFDITDNTNVTQPDFKKIIDSW